MPPWWRGWFARTEPAEVTVTDIRRCQAGYAQLGDDELRAASRKAASLAEVFALTVIVAERIIGLQMFDVQIQGALALAAGRIAEMQTGEGKTLAAVPAVVWYARRGLGVHVLTANDYLARRDAAWMRGIYEWFGLSVGVIQQGMAPAERRTAYRAD